MNRRKLGFAQLLLSICALCLIQVSDAVTVPTIAVPENKESEAALQYSRGMAFFTGRGAARDYKQAL